MLFVTQAISSTTSLAMAKLNRHLKYSPPVTCKITQQTFDPLGHLVQKTLPDGTTLSFSHDMDGNLIEYHLPNGNVWTASYDSMKRKIFEKIEGANQQEEQWNYFYEQGYLKNVTDPMKRIHHYHYDSHGRLSKETIDEWEKIYSYDPRGQLLFVKQTRSNHLNPLFDPLTSYAEEDSAIHRSYDMDGHLIQETIYLNQEIIQETRQKRTPSHRTLSVGDHTRTLTYQNHNLTQLSVGNLDLHYTYDLGGNLTEKRTPFHYSKTTYNSSSLPQTIDITTPTTNYPQSLQWSPSGKLSTYTTPSNQIPFTYTNRGYLQVAGEEQYTFDFGEKGIGTRTQALSNQVSQIDSLGRVIAETNHHQSITIEYNPMGQVTSCGEKILQWDPWGRLITVTDPTFKWEASYDPLGRRLQTRYTPQNSPTITIQSLYDIEGEFQEIGIRLNNKTFWKLYGPQGCDAIIDEKGDSAILVHSALHTLISVIIDHNIHPIQESPTPYGPQNSFILPSDLLSYATSLSWHSKSQDPTAFIWMGKRYYDPKGGRFLSPDPISYPIAINRYTYAAGDPINYTDPTGLFASHVYHKISNLPSYSIKEKINQLPAFLANHEIGSSHPYEVGRHELKNGAIGFINGIAHTKKDAIEKAYLLSQYANDAKIYGIYNATYSLPIDVLECLAGHFGIHTTPVQLLKNQWSNFILTHNSEAKFLQSCYSGGADHVKNALETSPSSIRQRIIVLAINPSVVIPEELCHESFNYMSKKDFVTKLDIIGSHKYRDQLHIVEPHPDAKGFDHAFTSPTFQRLIQEHIDKYMDMYGR